MENLTHSLIGAAIAELALPVAAPAPQRRLFFWAGIIAANLPDADLLYTRITPPPLGYLLHHRGHTHTLVGVLAQAALIGGFCLLPGIRGSVASSRGRFWMLIGACLLSHITLDWWNSYGVHPFYPFNMHWYYGDAISIFEPWFWVVLGTAAAVNAKSDYARLMLTGLFVALVVALGVFGVVAKPALVALIVVAGMLALLTKAMSRRARSGAALAATGMFVVAMFGAKQFVRERALASMLPGRRLQVIDVVLSPQPANPLCWSALAINLNERGAEYSMTRGVVSVTPGGMACGSDRGLSVQWDAPVRQSLPTLRTLARDDCWVRGWLQFSRAPMIGDGVIADYRFGGAVRGNFTSMEMRRGGDACPAHITGWVLPRADLIQPGSL